MAVVVTVKVSGIPHSTAILDRASDQSLITRTMCRVICGQKMNDILINKEKDPSLCMFSSYLGSYIYTWAVINDNSIPATKPAKDNHLYHNEDRY